MPEGKSPYHYDKGTSIFEKKYLGTSPTAKRVDMPLHVRLGISTHILPRSLAACSSLTDNYILEDKYICSFGGKNAYDRNEEIFKTYLNDKESIEFCSFSCSISDSVKNDLEYSFHKHEYAHRWTVSYKKRFLYRLFLLEKWYKWYDKPVTFLTLTTRQEGLDIQDQIMLLKEGFSQLLKNWRKLKGDRVKEGHISYLAAMDFHRTGYAHYHVVFFETISKYHISLLLDMWARKGFGDRDHGLKFNLKQKGEISKIVNYLFKHSAKVFHLNAPGAMKFHTTVFAMQHCENNEYPGVRLFSMSKDIAEVMKIPESDRDCLSFQMGDRLLYVNPDIPESEILFEIDKYRKWFEKLKF